MPFKNYKEFLDYQTNYNAERKRYREMTISFNKALKQVLLSVDTGYRAHGIDNVLDTPPEDQTELQRSVVMTLSREHQTFLEENAQEIALKLSVMFRCVIISYLVV